LRQVVGAQVELAVEGGGAEGVTVQAEPVLQMVGDAPQHDILADGRAGAGVIAVIVPVAALVVAPPLLRDAIHLAAATAAAEQAGEDVRVLFRGVAAAPLSRSAVAVLGPVAVEDFLGLVEGRAVDDGLVVVGVDDPLFLRVAAAPDILLTILPFLAAA